jgi:hypothetical protein
MDATSGARPGRTFRSSRRRVRKITMRGNAGWEIWLLLAWVIFLLLVVVPWMARHSR